MTMIKRHIILFTASECGPCKKELEDLSRFKKLRAFPKEENRFIIVNILDDNHSMWVELFRPMATPEVKIIDIQDLKVETTFSGIGCINAAWSYLNISTEVPESGVSKVTNVIGDVIPPIANSNVSGDMGKLTLSHSGVNISTPTKTEAAAAEEAVAAAAEYEQQAANPSDRTVSHRELGS
jgi:hypothetical protein